MEAIRQDNSVDKDYCKRIFEIEQIYGGVGWDKRWDLCVKRYWLVYNEICELAIYETIACAI